MSEKNLSTKIDLDSSELTLSVQMGTTKNWFQMRTKPYFDPQTSQPVD